MSLEWRLTAQIAAGSEDEPARPTWTDGPEGNGIPLCNLRCPHRINRGFGSKCAITGLTAPHLCEPVVAQMAKLLTRGPG